MELLKAVVPKLARVAVLRDPGLVQAHADAMEATGRSLGVALHTVIVSRAEDLGAAFATFKNVGAEALIPTASAVYTAHRARVVDLAAQHRLAAIYEHRDFVDVGGLMSYGPNFEELWRGAARYVDRILKGAKPGDLPVEQPTKFDLVVNLKTARALGLVVPPSVLLRADHVIE